LAQIIFEQENKAGQNLLPTTFLRQLIRFYGDSMQMVVPKYLEQSIATLTQEQEKFRKQIAGALSGTPFAPLEEQVRRNMELFQQTFSKFMPFAPRMGSNDAEKVPEPTPDDNGNIDDLRKQMKEMQDGIGCMSKETKKEEYFSLSPRQKQGPITTGHCVLSALGPQGALFFSVVVMGPGSRFVWPGRPLAGGGPRRFNSSSRPRPL